MDAEISGGRAAGAEGDRGAETGDQPEDRVLSMAMRPCATCGTPTSGPACPAHRSTYGRRHRASTAAAVLAEPWCHTSGGCPFTDAGTARNPLTGGHPLTLAEMGGDRAAWQAQPRVPQCHRCNVSRRPL
jgi:hypothetical protein